MDASPALDSPRAGDPITADWAADLAAAVNSAANPADRVGSVSSPFGKASPAPGLPMLGSATMPQPFDCAVVRPSGSNADKLYIWLPDGGAEFVVYDGKPLGPASGQSIGDGDTAWVEVGSITNAATRYVYLKFHTDANGDVDGWKIEDTATAWTPQSGGTGAQNDPPQILLAAYNIAADSNVPQPGTDNKFPSGQHGLVQYRHGTVALGDGAEILDTDISPGDPPGESVNRWQSTPTNPDPNAPIQIRQFHDTTDVLAMQGIGDTGSAPDATDAHVLLRQFNNGTSNMRPKLVYSPAATGPFWVKGAGESQNYGTGIKLGSPAVGYVTITVTE